MGEFTGKGPGPEQVAALVKASHVQGGVPRRGFAQMGEASAAAVPFHPLNAADRQDASGAFRPLPSQAEAGTLPAASGTDASARTPRRRRLASGTVPTGGDSVVESGGQRMGGPDTRGSTGKSLTERLRKEEVDEDAWREFVQGSGGKLLSKARRKASTDQDAEDDTQTAFLRTFVNRGNADNHEAYASSAVGTLAIDRTRSGARKYETVTDFEDQRDIGTPGHEDTSLVGITMRGLIADLSPRQRDVIDLLFFQGLTPTEAAGVLGVRPVAVRQTRDRAFDTLREKLGPAE